MAAAIKEMFGIVPGLVEGHNGIYEVTIKDNVVFTNQGKCTQLPTNEEVLLEIRKQKEPLPGKEIKTSTVFPIFKPER